MAKPTETQAWSALQKHHADMRETSLLSLFAADADPNADRAARYTVKLGGLSLDFSRNHLSDKTIELLVDLAETQGLKTWRDKLFSGERINASENRAVLHTALRSQSDAPVMLDGHDVMPDIRALHGRMKAFVDDVREGRWLGSTGRPIKHIVNIGIGGSDLGPRLAVSALRSYVSQMDAHFVANADAADLFSVLPKLDPAATLFIVVSKTFTTQETVLNAETARSWLIKSLGEQAVARHFVAVSSNISEVTRFGIPEANIFPMWDWVGGRFSVWSSVGLSVALALGWDHFRDFLAGAAAMDEHFRAAPLAKNLPVILGLIGIWYRNFWRTSCHAFLPYGERLRELPRYLQQMEMESNGKSVTRDGDPVDYSTAPAIIGECGTVGQHSFHQWLHQGTDLAPVDFVGIRQDDSPNSPPKHHRVLLANLAAQAEALMRGSVEAESFRANPGNRPSTLLWLDRLDPRSLGMLLALYEHKTFVQGVIWNINSFDQWGVELGKKLAREVAV